MTNTRLPPFTGELSDAVGPTHLGCGDIWAGSSRTAGLLELPGLDAWVHSAPAGTSEAGGDVHYISVCPSCIVSRVALADVSGHGTAVAALGYTLRALMHEYLHAPEQRALMRDLNRAVHTELNEVHYATMVAAGWHDRRGVLVLSNAGHPPPLWYRAGRNAWSWLDTTDAPGRNRPVGVPLGLLADVEYGRVVIKPEPGDLVVLYTDGASEATNESGEELGRDGLLDIARGLDPRSVESFGEELTSALRRFRGAVTASDDESIIVLQRRAPHWGSAPRRLGDAELSLGR
jgi:sigma-B regulation protein RsbU (phosphoserine phosphatase)